ncbi:MAG: hypothetical protein ACX93U_21585 [Salipiger thiooxidans]|uniref:hypothetical protein n=1 Tax=Salipiger thiooxidans TaxID=282683 RepID=UPI001CFB4A0F|nr:hypothetical protein [Salipiger thiooxidans]
MLRLIPVLVLALGLSACANGQTDLQKPAEPIGDFKLGHAIVVAPNIVEGPVSRNATAEEWIASVDAALEERFRRQDGDKFYHLGVSVEGFVLAQPGIPLVFSPKSALIVRVTAWDDAAQKKLNDTPEEITVLESFSAETVVGSGVTQSREQQMRNLSANMALQIEKWMRRMQKNEGWFGGPDAGKRPSEAASEPAEVAGSADSPQAPAAPGRGA